MPRSFRLACAGRRCIGDLLLHRLLVLRKQRTVHRQRAQPHARGREDRVGQCRCGNGGAHLAESAGGFAALHGVHLDGRRLVDAQHAVVVEVALLDGAALQRDLAEQRRAQPEQQAALDLRLDGTRVHRDATVQRDHRAPQAHLALRRHLDLDHGAHTAAEGVAHGHAAPDARGQRALAPADFFSRQVEHGERARVLLQQRAPVGHRVFLRAVRQLVDEAFHHEQVVRGPHAAPPAHVQPRGHVVAHPLDLQVRQVVAGLGHALDQVAVHAVLAHEGGRPAAQHRAAGDAVAEPQDLAVAVDHRRDVVVVHRSHDVVANVFLARPHHLQRVGHLLGEGHGLLDRVGLQPAAEAAAQVLVVHHHLVFGQPGDLGGHAHAARRHLRAHPDLALVGAHVHRGVQRLHGRVGQHGEVVGRLHQRALGPLAGFLADDGLALGQRLGQRRAQLLRGERRVLARRPRDLQRIEPALGGPEVLAHHRHRVLDANDVEHARNGARGLVVHRGQHAAQRGAGLDRGHLHARHAHVEAELRLAVDLVGGVHAAQRLADELEVLRLLQRHLARHRQPCGRAGERAEAELPAGGRVAHHAARHGAALGVDLPLRGGRSHQQRARHGARLAQHGVGAARAGRAPGDLAAEQRHAVQGLVGRRVLHAHLVELHAQLLGQQHRGAGVDGLAHLDHRHHEPHAAVGVDADEGVGREGGRAVRQCGSGVCGLLARADCGEGLAAADPGEGEREAAGLQRGAAADADRARDFCGGLHVALLAGMATIDCSTSGLPVAACLMAARMRE
jgi:hypothetical protein